MIFDKWLSASDAGDDNQRQTRLTRKTRSTIINPDRNAQTNNIKHGDDRIHSI
jgi:hypothetical protein